MIADYISTTRTILGRVDRNQLSMMLGYLTRLRNRHGTLHLLSTAGLPTHGFTRATGIRIRTCWAGPLLTNDALLITPPHSLVAFPREPVILSICGAADGDLARASATTVIIPSFSVPIVTALTAVIWQGLIQELSCESS